MTSYLRLIATMLLLALAVPAQADDEYGPTPPRLSYFKGDVAVYREQGEGWEEVRLNLPIAAGDALDTGAASTLELQLGSHAYIRADSHTRLQLAEQQTRSLRLEIDSGRLALDLRELPEEGYLVDVNARGALFTLERPGYYRFDVDQDVRLSVRQGGLASVIPAGGEGLLLHSSETLWLTGGEATHSAVSPAAEPDAWDRWNLTRTDDLIEASSARYLPAGVAGAHELDRYGSWRVTTTYGPVWAPYSVVPGWVPYGSGHWVWDPYYQWTWVDDAPWGWAPFHYGRWIYLGNRWVWAPGPLIRRPVYSPALVAFFYYGPQPAYRTCWVALGWGEPVVPWWGRPALHGKPSWHGWGGPRLVNRKAVQPRTTINAGAIVYANSQVSNALVAVAPEQFGRRDMQKTRLSAKSRVTLRPGPGALPQPPGLRSRSDWQPQEPRVPRRAEGHVADTARAERPESRGAANLVPRKEAVRQRELQLPYAQGTPDEPARTKEAQPASPGSTSMRESSRRSLELKRPATPGQPRELRLPDMPRSSVSAERQAERAREIERAQQAPYSGAGVGVGQLRPEQSRTIRSTPYGLDSDSSMQRMQPRIYQQQPSGARWDARDRRRGDDSGRNPEPPAGTQ